jgi:hypothetical protein
MDRPRTSWRKITWRTAIMFAAAAFVLAYPIYTVIEQSITHGIHQRGDFLDVDMQAMSNFNFDQARGRDDDIPRPYRDLDGKRVRLFGEMVMPSTAGGFVDQFQLCYSIQNCCFGGPPRVQHFVYAKVLPGRSVAYTQGLVNVTGTLHVGVERADGQVSSVYRMDVEKVE